MTSLRFRGGGAAEARFKDLLDWQRRSLDENHDRQRRSLMELYRYAQAKVPYYGKLAPLDESASTVQDLLSQIPLLDKQTIRREGARLHSGELQGRNPYPNTSGGSTGEPVQLVQDGHYWDWGIAAKLLFDRWTGYEVGQPKAVLWGSERDLFKGKERFVVAAGRRLKNEHWLNTFRMTDRDMRAYIDQINVVRPTQILAYVESIYELSLYVEREGQEVYSPGAILTSAGTLQDHMRETIERVFRCKVFNRYGSREVGDPACQCESGLGLHVCMPTHVIEVLNEEGSPAAPGELGELVVTLLTNYSMPLIRYRIGDMGSWSQSDCSCGRSWPTLCRIAGRTNSLIRTPTATLDSAAISALLYYKSDDRSQVFAAFSKYRFIQEAPDRVLVRVVVEDIELWGSERDLILRKLATALGADVKIRFEEVDDIAPSASGKYSFIESKVENSARKAEGG